MVYSIEDFLKVKSAVGGSFSPDASRIVYMSNLTGTRQLYLVGREGGTPVQLTEFADPVSEASFSPTQNIIMFSKDEGGNEQYQLYLIDPDTKEVTPLTANKNVRHGFGVWSRDGKYFSYGSNERNGKDFDIYVMDVAARTSVRVYAEGGWAAAGPFSPDNRYLAVGVNHSNVNSDLYLYDWQNGGVEHITPHTGDASYSMPRWLPDSSAFFFTSDEGREFSNVTRYSVRDKRHEFVIEPTWDVDRLSMRQDGTLMALVINEEGYSRLKMYDPATLKEVDTSLAGMNISGAGFSKDGRYVLLGRHDSRHTHDLWVFDTDSQQLTQLTQSPQGVPPEVLVEPKLARYESFDGLSVPYFIYKPAALPEGGKAPVVFNIHGGPEAQYQPGLDLLMQYFIHQGYAVVAPNVRGSSGYGKSYLALDDVEKRMDSVQDLVALKRSLAADPELDVERIALMGGSYGGFMVLAGLAFYPEEWAAGVDIVGISNFVTFLENTAVYRRALREAEYGSLEHDKEFLKSVSPIHAVDKIQAPLFIIHGANDPRVPLSEAQQIVTKLGELGRTAELLVYEDEGHGLSKLKNRLDAYPKVANFLKNILMPEEM